MIFSWLVIGIVVGVVLGLTGAGGAIIAVPLFLYLIGVDIAQATVLSLISVSTGAVFTWWFQRSKTQVSVSVLMALFSLLGASAFIDLKKQTPAWGVFALFSGVALFSLYSIWKKQKKAAANGSTTAALKSPKFLMKAGISGFVLGGLTTMTGLGGGVMLVPWLVGPMGLIMERAVPTSLLTIFFASLVSLYSQKDSITQFVGIYPVLMLMSGSVLSAILLKKFSSSLSVDQLNKIRKYLLTGIILFSISASLVKMLG